MALSTEEAIHKHNELQTSKSAGRFEVAGRPADAPPVPWQLEQLMHNADPPLGDPNLGDVLAMPPSTRAEFSSADAPAWQPMVDRSTVAAGGRLSLPPVPPSAPSDAGSVAGEHRDETLESASRRHLQLPHASPPQTPPRQSYTYRSSGHHGGGGGPGDHAVGGGAPPPPMPRRWPHRHEALEAGRRVGPTSPSRPLQTAGSCSQPDVASIC